MKTIKTIGLLLTAAVVYLATPSCSDKEDEPIEPVNLTEADIVGAWTDGDEDLPEFYKFYEDGSGAYITTDEDGNVEPEISFTWTIKNGTLTLKSRWANETFKIVKATSKMLQFDDEWTLYRINMSDVPSAGNAANPALTYYVGTWTGSDGSDVIVAKFSEDGSYTDWQIRNGKKEFEKKGRYEVNGSKVTIPENSNLNDLWGRTYTVKFNDYDIMTWTNSLMDNWGVTWIFEKE